MEPRSHIFRRTCLVAAMGLLACGAVALAVPTVERLWPAPVVERVAALSSPLRPSGGEGGGPVQAPQGSSPQFLASALAVDSGSSELSAPPLASSTKATAKDHVLEARERLEQRDLSGALRSAMNATREDGDNAQAWNVVGRVSMMQSEWERAELAFRRATVLAPDSGMFWNNLGLLYVKSRRSTEAIEALEASVELFDQGVPAYVFNNLGLAYEQEGFCLDAVDAFEAALEIRPLYPRAKLNLDRVSAKASEVDEAGEGC